MSTELITTRPFEDHEQRVYDALNQVTSGVANPEDWLIDALGGSSVSTSGTPVNTSTVLGLPAAWRSIDMISSKLGSMPVKVQKKLPDKSYEDLDTHPVDRLMNRFAGGLYTTFTLRQTMTLHGLLRGNGRAYIMRDALSRPESLTIMQPEHTYTIVVDGEKFHVVFFTRDQYGDTLTPEVAASMAQYNNTPITTASGGYYFVIPDIDVLHIPGMSYNGLWGMPLVSIAKDAFGLDKSGQDAVSYQFRNGGRPGLLLTAPKGMFRTDKEAKEFMDGFNQKHSGTQNQGRTGLLREGMTGDLLTSQNTFQGLKDLKSTTREDIALLFGTEYLLGEAAAVYKDLQSRMTAFVQNTLDKWMETWEQECGRKLLNRQSYLSGLLRVHLDPSASLRGTPNELADYTGKLRTQGLISGNEGRGYHSLRPVPELEADYGNPNTTSNTNEEPAEPEPEEDEPEEDSDETMRGRLAVSRHFSKMLQFESKRVKECSQDASGFIDRIDSFYDDFEEKLTDLCADLLINTDLAAEHCKESKAQILQLAGVAFADNLHKEMSELVSTWSKRCAKFTNL